ncbi:MAG: STAS domain-containing protein [Candidatus Auribacterota bacterium]|nr:STAS domain-containing protein [Candidatus Auribacterota bacterium]
MEFSPKEPYKIIPQDKHYVVIQFAPKCDQVRRKEQEDELEKLVEDYNIIACDLSKTEMMGTDWIRWLERLSIEAGNRGKMFVLVAMGELVKQTADIIGLKGKFKMKDTLEEVKYL